MDRTITQGLFKHANNIRILSAENQCQPFKQLLKTGRKAQDPWSNYDIMFILYELIYYIYIYIYIYI